MSTQNMAKNNKKEIKEKRKITKIKIKCVGGWGGGGGSSLFALSLISNTLPQLEQSSLHPQQFSVIASCYRPPATTISVFSYTSTSPVKNNRTSNRLGPPPPLSRGVEKPEGPSALQPTTEMAERDKSDRARFFGKIVVWPKSGKKCPKWPKMDVSIFISKTVHYFF